MDDDTYPLTEAWELRDEVRAPGIICERGDAALIILSEGGGAFAHLYNREGGEVDSCFALSLEGVAQFCRNYTFPLFTGWLPYEPRDADVEALPVDLDDLFRNREES